MVGLGESSAHALELISDKAFEMLRDHSQHDGRKLSDVAGAVVESHLLLLWPTPSSAPPA